MVCQVFKCHVGHDIPALVVCPLIMWLFQTLQMLQDRMDPILIVKQVILSGFIHRFTAATVGYGQWCMSILGQILVSQWTIKKYGFGLVDHQNILFFTGPLCVLVIQGAHESMLHVFVRQSQLSAPLYSHCQRGETKVLHSSFKSGNTTM